ncbi:MAG: DUF5596 domain-containing protein [Clostridia bacterium]|nr:DUF5596 domain-containing protein [Clostridia bacterium]
MKHWNAQIEQLTQNGYAPEVVEGIKALEQMLDDDAALASVMDSIVYRYVVTEELSMADALAEIKQAAKQFGKNEYSLDLLLIVNSLPRLYEKYQENGISDEIFYESMDDIRCKVNECVENKGVVGTFVADWYDRFFKLTCFGYGRFQYEVMTYEGEDFTLSCGKVFKAGDKYVNMHIPSRGISLTDEVRLDSYRKAYPHFAPLFEDGIVIFGCSSWLLYPRHREFLPAGMNLLKFMGDFEMVSGKETPDDFHDRWRVFGRYTDLPDAQLPKDTTLRRAYAEWLQAGNPTGRGFGVFAFDGENFVRS